MPLAAPVFATQIKDQCKNIEGAQESVPDGYYQKDCKCYEEPKEEPPVATEPATPRETPVATPPAVVETPKTPTLPNTGGGIEFLMLSFGIAGIGGLIKFAARKGTE